MSARILKYALLPVHQEDHEMDVDICIVPLTETYIRKLLAWATLATTFKDQGLWDMRFHDMTPWWRGDAYEFVDEELVDGSVQQAVDKAAFHGENVFVDSLPSKWDGPTFRTDGDTVIVSVYGDIRWEAANKYSGFGISSGSLRVKDLEELLIPKSPVPEEYKSAVPEEYMSDGPWTQA